MRNYKIKVVSWLNENEFIGTGHKKVKYSRDRGVTWVTEEQTVAVYGWTRPDRSGVSFSVYKIVDGHIEKLGSIRRDALDTATTTV